MLGREAKIPMVSMPKISKEGADFINRVNNIFYFSCFKEPLGKD